MRELSSEEILAAFPSYERPKVVLAPPPPRWDDLDFLGWIHRSGHLAFLVCETAGGLAGQVFGRSVVRSRGLRRFMCDLCCTLHEPGGVACFTRWNRARTAWISRMICADLQCSSYVRGKRASGCVQMSETLDAAGKIERLKANLGRMVAGLDEGDC